MSKKLTFKHPNKKAKLANFAKRKCLEENLQSFKYIKMINKHSTLVIVCFIFLPILSSCFTLKNDKNTVESSEKSKEQIRCKFYNSTCIREAKENGIDDSKCHGTQQCPDKFCYAVWKNQTVPQNQTNLPHESAKHDIKMMGCLGVGSECFLDCKISCFPSILVFTC